MKNDNIKKDAANEIASAACEKITDKKKTVIIILAAALLLIGIASFIIVRYPSLLGFMKDDIAPNAVETMPSKNFAAPDYSLVAENVPDYMELDRELKYTNGGLTVGVNEQNCRDFTLFVSFFYDYFQALIDGSYTVYDSYFTSAYYDSDYYKKYAYQAFGDKFAPQLIYDINVALVSGDENKSVFSVAYKIYDNNGTFRRDIGSDASRTQYYTLVKQNGKILIDRIVFER